MDSSYFDESADQLRPLATFPFHKPSFISVANDVSSGRTDLLVSTFGVDVFGQHPDGVAMVADIAEALRTKKFTAARVGGALTW